MTGGDAKKPAAANSPGGAKAKVSLNALSKEDVASLKDELLRSIATRGSNADAEAYGRHSNVHSSNSNTELPQTVEKVEKQQ